MKRKLRKFKKLIYSHQVEAIVILISIIICILGTSLLGWFIIPIILILDLLIFYSPKIEKWIKKTFSLSPKVKVEKVKPVKEINTEIIKEDIKVEGSPSEMPKKDKIKKTKKVKNKSSKKKNSLRKVLKIILLVILIGIIFLFVGAIAFWLYIVKVSPKFSEDNLYKKESTILYDKDGEVFAKLGSEFREKITYDQLPEVLINAIIATEDSRFFQHNGFDLPRFLKASAGQVIKKLFGVGGNAGGASTLTMQIAKNAFNGDEDEGIEGIIRKFKDIYVSINEIEKNYTKEQIIEFYANSYLLGGNIYGVEQAALSYFGKHAKDLNLSEAAIIAGLYQSPNAYNPYRNPKNAAYRRKIVLSLMVRHGYITQEEADAANAIPVESLVVGGSVTSNNEYQGFIDTVVYEVKQDTGHNAYTTPMEIHTTLDRTKQDIVNRAMRGETYAWENALVDAGVSVLNTQNGEIAAVGIGRNTSGIGLRNNATFDGLIKPQIGSTAKPLYDYAPAIEFNNFSPANLIGDERYFYSDGPEITNWDGAYQSLITARQALAGSRNVPALKVFQQVKNKNILDFVTNLGLSPEVDGGIHEAHAIGGYNGESPMTISAAYAAFANGGIYNEPHSYRKLTYRDTGEEVVKKYESRRAMKDSTAFIVYDMLVSTSQEAMRGYRNINNWKYGAKTGTSNFTPETKRINGLASDAINDLWCTGVTDEYSISVWYGYDKIYKEAYTHFLNSNHIILLRTIASQVWTRGANVEKPESVISVQYETGNVGEVKLPSKYTPEGLKAVEYFVKGSEPTEVSTRFSQLSNIKNLTSSYSNGTVTLSWDKIPTPNGLNKEYLKKYFSSTFKDENWLMDAVINRYNYYDILLGGIVYNVYQQDSNENLKLVGSTNEDEINIEITSTATNPTYIIKTSWANYQACDSTGVKTTVDVSKGGAILSVRLVGDNTVTIKKGESFTTSIETYQNDSKVSASVKVSITNAEGKQVATSLTNIPSLAEGTYKIKYTASYAGSSKSISRTLIIEKETN